MVNNKTVLAIVPARKDSKRLKLKNLRIFRGNPLFYWPLILSKKSKHIDKVVFTTDCKSMYFKAKKNFQILNYTRPKNLAKNDSLARDVILDVLKKIWLHRDEKYDCGLVIFLSSSKHKIKKKAEQAACKSSIEKLS